MANKKKRYLVSMDFYVFADNDYMARKKAHEVRKENNIYAREPRISEIGSQPFGSAHYRKLDDISEPSSKDMPF